MDIVTPYEKQKELLPPEHDPQCSCPAVRSAWVRFRAQCLRLVSNPNFELTTALIIVLNAIVLGLNWCVCHLQIKRDRAGSEMVRAPLPN